MRACSSGKSVLARNPDCVLVDTAVIAKAPTVFLVSGMGDALATYWEADTCAKSNKPNVLTGEFPPTLTALNLARLCYDTLLEHGVLAKAAVDRDAVTPSVEAIVEANTLLSGLGFESGGLAAAHSVHNGLTVLKESPITYHGQKVAFGTITQLVLEGRSRRRPFRSARLLPQRGFAGLPGGPPYHRPQPGRHRPGGPGHHGARGNHPRQLVPGDSGHGRKTPSGRRTPSAGNTSRGALG